MSQCCIRVIKEYRNINTATEEEYNSEDYYDLDYDKPDLTTEMIADRLIIGYFEDGKLGDFVYYMEEDYDVLWKGWYYGEIVYIKPE